MCFLRKKCGPVKACKRSVHHLKRKGRHVWGELFKQLPGFLERIDFLVHSAHLWSLCPPSLLRRPNHLPTQHAFHNAISSNLNTFQRCVELNRQIRNLEKERKLQDYLCSQHAAKITQLQTELAQKTAKLLDKNKTKPSQGMDPAWRGKNFRTYFKQGKQV